MPNEIGNHPNRFRSDGLNYRAPLHNIDLQDREVNDRKEMETCIELPEWLAQYLLFPLSMAISRINRKNSVQSMVSCYMKTNPNTGELFLKSGFVLSPRTTRSAFLSSLEGPRSKVLVKNEPWCSFQVEDAEESLVIVVSFQGEVLESMDLALVNEMSGTGWAEWSQEREIERARETEEWAIGKGLVPGKKYLWGSVWAGYDPKGGSGSVVVRYRVRS